MDTIGNVADKSKKVLNLKKTTKTHSTGVMGNTMLMSFVRERPCMRNLGFLSAAPFFMTTSRVNRALEKRNVDVGTCQSKLMLSSESGPPS